MPDQTPNEDDELAADEELVADDDDLDEAYTEGLESGYTHGFNRCLELMRAAGKEIGLTDQQIRHLVAVLNNGPKKRCPAPDPPAPSVYDAAREMARLRAALGMPENY